jgi:hypothetical protein
MKGNLELLQERTERLKKAINLEKPDRTPVFPTGDAFCAIQTGMKLSDFVADLKLSNDAIFNCTQMLGDVDGVGVAFGGAAIAPLMFFTRMKLPGRELSDNTMWQIDEQELMTIADYDTIVNKGWKSFSADYLKKRLAVDVDELYAKMADLPGFTKRFQDAGYVIYSPVASLTVNEYISAGRSFPKFMRDIFKMPDKVEAVLDVIQEETLADLRQQIKAIKPLAVFISPSRGASQFYSPKIWERFVWKYLKAVSDMIIEEGSIVNFHIDGNWERDLEFFKQFPLKKAIFESDGATNIYKIKEVLGEHMCIKGDVPAALLTLGNPDEVYRYCSQLIKDIGPGLILASGCTIPPNAKLENVKAMVSAATGR